MQTDVHWAHKRSRIYYCYTAAMHDAEADDPPHHAGKEPLAAC